MKLYKAVLKHLPNDIEDIFHFTFDFPCFAPQPEYVFFFCLASGGNNAIPVMPCNATQSQESTKYSLLSKICQTQIQFILNLSSTCHKEMLLFHCNKIYDILDSAVEQLFCLRFLFLATVRRFFFFKMING